MISTAEELHFGRAADRLYIAQPALSRSIQQLERRLGRRLFVRTTRSVKPTEHATRLVPAAREVLEALNELAGEVRSNDRLRVAHVPCSDTAALLLRGRRRVADRIRAAARGLAPPGRSVLSRGDLDDPPSSGQSGEGDEPEHEERGDRRVDQNAHNDRDEQPAEVAD
jgi:hypothetical protein